MSEEAPLLTGCGDQIRGTSPASTQIGVDLSITRQSPAKGRRSSLSSDMQRPTVAHPHHGCGFRLEGTAHESRSAALFSYFGCSRECDRASATHILKHSWTAGPAKVTMRGTFLPGIIH